MIIVMSPAATEENLAQVKQKIEQAGVSYHLSMGESRTIVGVIGDKKRFILPKSTNWSAGNSTRRIRLLTSAGSRWAGNH